MGKVHLSPDLFLGTAELNRLIGFLDDDGFRIIVKNVSKEFGIVDLIENGELDSFKVIEGDSVGSIKIEGVSLAIDSDGQFIRYNSSQSIPLTDDNKWRWVKISHKLDPVETGTVSIDVNGNLTGVGTSFTDVLRGKSLNQSMIMFPNSSNNTSIYNVVEVVDDTNALLAGTFVPESGIEYSVFGTFTAGASPSVSDREPLRYDSCQLTLILDEINPIPSKTDGTEFWIARVKRNGSTVSIQDKRFELWKPLGVDSMEHLRSIGSVTFDDNPLIGVEGIKWDNANSARIHNIVMAAWGMRSSNWTINTNTRVLTINGGNGGKYKSTDRFVDGDFNGWRVYVENGYFVKVINSWKAGSQINMELDILNDSDFVTGETILVVPPVDEVQIRIWDDASDDEVSHIQTIFTYPVNTFITDMRVLVPAVDEYYINIQYRYKIGSVYTDWTVIPDDDDDEGDGGIGYYDESSYDDDSVSGTPDGVLNSLPQDRNQVEYTGHVTNGFIKLAAHPRSYSNTINTIYLGDIYGVNQFLLDNDNPAQDKIVGTDRVYQDGNVGYALIKDHFINLSKTGAVNGNRFVFMLRAVYQMSLYKLYFVEDYIDPTNYSLIKEFDSDMLSMVDEDHPFIIEFIYNGTNWIDHGFSSRSAGYSDHVWDRIQGTKVIDLYDITGEDLGI